MPAAQLEDLKEAAFAEIRSAADVALPLQGMISAFRR
jgi:hypothetical protein